MPTTLRTRVAVLGDAGVGKSSIITVFHKAKQFQKNYVMTVGCEFLVRPVKIPDTDTTVELFLLDTGGHPIYQAIRGQYWPGCSQLVVVFDVTQRSSFENIPKWIEEYKKNTGNKIKGVIIGAKNDLNDHATVTAAEASQFAGQHGFAYFECSALSGTDVDAPFNFIANSVHLAYEERIAQLTDGGDGGGGGSGGGAHGGRGHHDQDDD